MLSLISVWLVCQVVWVGGQASLHDSLDFVIGIAVPKDLEDSACKEAHKGYKLFENELKVKKDRGELVMQFANGNRIPFSIQVKYFESGTDLVTSKDEIDFVLGCEDEDPRDPVVWRAAHADNKMFIRCCSQRKIGITNLLSTTFDLQPEGVTYTDLLTRSLLLQGLQRYAVYYDIENSFHKSACDGAIKLIEGFQGVDSSHEVIIGSYSKSNMTVAERQIHFGRLAEIASLKNIESVFACLDEDDAEELVRAFDNLRYPLKTLFLSDGPANHSWAERLGELAEDVLTASLWRERQLVFDNFYGSSEKFIRKLRVEFGDEAQVSSAAAGAAVSGHILTDALQKAFYTCDPGSNVNKTTLLATRGGVCATAGFIHIREWLRQDSFKSIIGTVRFSRKNVNIEYPGTLQLDSNLRANVILPLAEKPMVMPARNRFLQACQPGDFNVGDGFEGCRPCEPGSFSNSTDVKECTLCPLGFFNPEAGRSSCYECPKHTTTVVKGATSLGDCTCRVGYYGNSTGVECNPCPTGATCEGSTMPLVALWGFWKEETTLEVFQCDPPSNCLGAGECKDGWEGVMCTSCKMGHFKLGDSCQECPGRFAFGLLIMLLYLGWYLLNVTVSGSMASLDMLLGFAQLANVIGDVELQWPRALETTFAVTNILDFDLDIMWPSCLFSGWSFAHNFFVQLLFPVVMGLMALCGFLLSKFCLWFIQGDTKESTKGQLLRFRFALTVPLNKEQLDEKWDYTIAACIAAVEVSSVTVAKYLFVVFKCTQIAGYEVLDESPDIVCDSETHRLLIGGAVVGILFYCIGYPVFVAGKLLSMHIHRSYPNPRNVRRYGFLYKRFEPGYIWMSMIVIIRRLAFVLALVSMDSPAFQAASLALITTGSLILHVYTAPYVDTYLDVLFSFLLVALTFETFGGLMFFNDNLTQNEIHTLETFVLSVMCCVGIVFIIIFAIELRAVYLVHRIRRLHVQAVLFKDPSSSSDVEGLIDHERPVKTDPSEVSKELLQTFDPGFLYSGLLGWREGLQEWDRLTDKLKVFMSDGSETSYLSTDNIARFWRKLVAKFPELIDFLAITDTATRDHFVVFINALYSNYFLTKKVEKLQIFSVLNWRDRAPLAHWLSSCSEGDRRFFADFMTRLFQRAHGQQAGEHLAEKVKTHQGSASSTSLSQSASLSCRRAREQFRILDMIPKNFLPFPENERPLGFMKSHRQRSIKEEIQRGQGPLRHSAHHKESVHAQSHPKPSSETIELRESRLTVEKGSLADTRTIDDSENQNVMQKNDSHGSWISQVPNLKTVEDKHTTVTNRDLGDLELAAVILDMPRKTTSNAD